MARTPDICADCGTLSTRAQSGGCVAAGFVGGFLVLLSFLTYLVLWRSLIVIIAAVVLACAHVAQASTVRCSGCGGKTIIPVTSPRGRKLVEDQGGQVIEG